MIKNNSTSMLIKQAEQGDAEAQFKLAMAYYEGNGIGENHEKAFEWWLKAAEQEVPGAMLNLGTMYRDGDGVEQDLFNAMYWFGKAHRYGVKEAMDAINDIRLWIVRECGNTTSEYASRLYSKDIELFIKEKEEKIDKFIADCKKRKKYKPENFAEIDSESSLIVYFNYPGPTSVRKKGFKEFLLSNLLIGRADRLWHWNNREWAYAYLDASLDVIKDLSEPWVPHEWARYYNIKGQYYIQEKKWEKAEMAFKDYLRYQSICYMSQFAMDDENIYKEMSQDELDDFCSSELSFYDRCVTLIKCLIQQNKMEEAQAEFSYLYSMLESRIKRQDSYIVDEWILNELKNEANPEVQFNLIRIFKHFGIADVYTFCLLYCEKLEQEMYENGVGNGYQWSREQYEVVEQMFSFALSYIEQSPQDNLQKSVHTLLIIYKGEYLMQTRRFILAEKHFLQSLEMIKNKLDEERTENEIQLLTIVIRLFNELYSVQNRRAEKLDYFRSLIDLFTDDEKQMDCYLELCKNLKNLKP